MHEIQLKDAKAKLSSIVDQALKGEVYAITRHSRKEAVVLSWAEWERLSAVPSLGRLLTMAPLDEDDLLPRNQSPLRESDL